MMISHPGSPSLCCGMRHSRRSILGGLLATAFIICTPALAQEGTPVASPAGSAPAAEVLLDTTLEGLLTGHAIVEVDRWELRPSATPLHMPALGGPVVVMVDSGAMTMTAGEEETHLGAGEYRAKPGDEAAVFLNEGPEPAVVFVVYVIPSIVAEGWESDLLAHTIDYPISASADDLPGGAAHVLLERLIFAPGAVLPPQEASPLVWYGIGEGRITLALEGDRLPFRWDSGEKRAFAAGQYFPVIAPGTRMTFRNAGDQPVELYRLTLTPTTAYEAPATPTAATPAP